MIEFKVPDMRCGHCVRAIETTVKETDSAAQVSVDLARQTVAITSEKAMPAFVAALTEAGYPPLRS